MMRTILQCVRTCALLLVLTGGLPAQAGVMTREAMAQAFPAPLVVGEKERDLPVWPIYAQDLTSTSIVAYAFESIDFAAIPGFSGTPFNLLVALDKNGKFMDVKVLSQHEPVFLDGLGPQPLFKFVEQYKNLSLKQSIKIGLNHANANQANSANVYITNLPNTCKISIYSLDGTLIRVLQRAVGVNPNTNQTVETTSGEPINQVNVSTSVTWDLTNSAGVPIASGVYLFHIDAPGIGQTTLKWFGAVRPDNITNY